MAWGEVRGEVVEEDNSAVLCLVCGRETHEEHFYLSFFLFQGTGHSRASFLVVLAMAHLTVSCRGGDSDNSQSVKLSSLGPAAPPPPGAPGPPRHCTPHSLYVEEGTGTDYPGDWD